MKTAKLLLFLIVFFRSLSFITLKIYNSLSKVIIFLLGKRITKTPIQNFYKIYLLLSLVARISRKCYPSKLRSHYFLSSHSSFSSWFLIGTSNGGWVTSGVRNEPSINFSLGSTYSFSNCLYFLRTKNFIQVPGMDSNILHGISRPPYTSGELL